MYYHGHNILTPNFSPPPPLSPLPPLEQHVMQTLFNTELSEEELNKMVSDVDKDNDGEVSFEEFQAKVQEVINETQQADVTGSPVQETHWHSLSRLISQFSEIEQQKGGGTDGGGE